MQRLVMIYDQSDDYTYSGEDVIPVLYESKETFLNDFMELVREAYKKNKLFDFNDMKFDPADFIESSSEVPPEVYTLDEWFEKFHI